MNAVMAGVLYFLGTVFGVLGAVIGGEVLTSLTFSKPLAGVDMLGLVAANSSRLTGGAFFTLMMGISLVAMTVFLYPIFRKDSEELAMGMVLFRGALEGTWYFITTLGFLTLVALGNEYIATGADSAALQSMGNVLYQFQDRLAAVGTHLFSHWGYVFIPLLLPHPADPPLVVRLGLDRRGFLYGFRPVAFLSHGYRLWVLFGNGVGATGNSNGGLAYRQGIQSICDRCPVC